jgi:hypothetical protein
MRESSGFNLVGLFSPSESSPNDIGYHNERSHDQHLGNELNVGTRKFWLREIIGPEIEDCYCVADAGDNPSEVSSNLEVKSAYKPPEKGANHCCCNPRNIDQRRTKQHFDPARNWALKYSPSDCLQDDVNEGFPKANELASGAYFGEAWSNPNDASNHETEQIEEQVR